ncbi:MAG: DUF6641 family protein [Kordiimonas sp.]
MSKLAKLKLSARTRAGMLKSPILRARAKLSENLRVQIEGAKAELDGWVYERREKRWVLNEETGVRDFIEVPIKFRPWWWRDEAGNLLLSIKHGAKRLEILKEKPTIEVGEEKELVPTLETLLEAVEAGDLDDHLAEARNQIRERLKSKK